MNYETYLNHISAYEREFKDWESRTDKIVKRYRDDKKDTQRSDVTKFNVLWSNVQTLKAATYARTPMPDVSRRFKDNDPTGRVAALLLERALEFMVTHFRGYGATLGQCTYDRFLGGRGTAWVRYEPTFKPAEGQQVTEDADTDTPTAEELVDENVPVDYVHWKDFGHQVVRTWEECTLVWRKVYMSAKVADERFPDVKLPMDASPDEDQKMRGSVESDTVNKMALVYEVWNKEEGVAVWLSKSLGKIIDEKEDPLGLEEFFPCPPPIFSTLTTDSLIPVPDFILYQDQANELDILSNRIDGLINALQIKGVYDASIPELERLFTEADNGTLIPVKNWAGLAEKKGLGGAIEIYDILPLAQALSEAYKAFEQVKGQIYELTGISDILRGETAPSETATAQQIKNSYASLRLKVYQDEVERFASRLLQMMAQVICNHFDPQTIAKLACWEQLSDADKPLVFTQGQPLPTGQPGPMMPGPALLMLKSGVTNSMRIEVETDSMAYQDEQQEKQDRMEFLKAAGGFLQTLMQAAQETPQLLPLAGELAKFGVTGFRIGKNLEGVFDQAIEQMKQAAQQAASQPKPNPEAMKAQAASQTAQINAQAKAQTTQLSEQAETQREQMRIQATMQQHASDQAHEAQLVAIDARNKHAQDAMKEAFEQRQNQLANTFEAQMEQMRLHAAQQTANTNAMLQQFLQNKKSDTAIEVAEIAAQTTLDAAQISAARSADE